MSTDTTTRDATRTQNPPRPAVVAPTVSEQELTFGGFRFVCRVVGAERPGRIPLLILGGSSQNRLSWVRHESLLAPAGPLITVDLPGYGDADPLPTRYGMDFLAAAVRHLLYELELPAVTLLGACFGGAIALRFAQHYPVTVHRLILVGMTTRLPPEYLNAIRQLQRMLDAGRYEEAARQLVTWFMSPPGAARIPRHAALSRMLYHEFMQQTTQQRAMAVYDHNERLLGQEWYRPEPVPRVPALVFTGEYDSLTTPAMGREVAAALAGAAFTTIRQTDHLLHMERIEPFADLVTRFATDRPIADLPYCTPVEYLPPEHGCEPANSVLATG